jgi:hypothetical protein
MTLTLRKGWKTFETDCCIYFYAPEGLTFGSGWYADIDRDTGSVSASADGGHDSVRCESIEEAHEYLLSVGSESPWEAPC